MTGTIERFEVTFGSFGQQYTTIDGQVYLTWFDAADPEFYHEGDISAGSATPVEHCRAFSMIGTHYRLNEYRASWKTAGSAPRSEAAR